MTVAALIGAAAALTGCDSDRSSNPLSPNIAGPLAGVTITAPAAVGPLNAVLLPSTDQPITLTFGSANSNSVRPFSYEVQIATDAEFTQILLEITDIASSETGQVLVVLAQTLESDQVYYWRVRALDGANTGAYSGAASFEVFTPVVIPAPVVSGPTSGETTPTNTPSLVVTNAEITGPAESIMYRFELSTEPTFATPSAILTVTQAAGTTTSVGPGGLPYEQMFYWRARVSAQARNGEVIGPWTPTASFRTPEPPVIITAPTPTSPIGGTTISTLRPTLIAANGIVSGEAGTVTYEFEIDDDSSFASPASTFSVTRSPGGSTGGIATVDLVADRQYFWRVRGTNGTLTSSWSATATFRTPPVVIAAPTPTSPIGGTTVNGLRPTLVAANGTVTGVTGPVTYQFEADDESSFASPASTFSVLRSPAGSTSGSVTLDLAAGRQYFWRVRGVSGAVIGSWSATATFSTAASAPPGPPPPGGPAAPPAPDPPGGSMLPLPDMSSVVQQVAAENPGALANSCQEAGGSWDFMDLVMDRLRQSDGRWGFNCKRGNCGDVSQDVVDYHWGGGSASGSTEVYIIDMIGGHCGPDPSPEWNDVTAETANAGTIGRWIFPR
jgi:phosphodiesterase/alkaline phosphatase D-like protein